MTSEPDYPALFEASPYPYLLINTDFILIGANAAYLDATGTTKAAILGKHIFEAFPANPDDPASTNLDEVRRSIEIAIATGKPHTSPLLRYAVPHRLPDATVFQERIWSAVHTPVRDAGGQVSFVAQTAVDVTDLYRFDAPGSRYVLKQNLDAVPDIAERTRPQLHEALTRILAAERSELKTLFDQAPGFIAVLHHANHVFAMANDAFHRLVGQRPLIGMTIWDALPEVAGQGLEQSLEDAARSGRPIVLHKRKLALRRVQGGALSEHYVDLLFRPVLDADGGVAAMFVQGHDVTDAYLANLALEEKMRQLEASRERQTMLLELGDRLRGFADDADAMLDAANEELARFLGVPRAGYVTFVEDSSRALVLNTYHDPQRVPALPAVVEQPDDYGRSVIAELRAGRPILVDDMDTDPRTRGAVAEAHAAIGARASLAVPVMRQGRSVGFMFAHDDRPRRWSREDRELMVQVADRTWEAAERAHALLALREADRRKDDFLAMLAHELRNPLAPIGAAAQLLQLGRTDDARLRHTSDVISRQVRHMTGLIDDLLDVSRVTRGLVKLHPADLDVRDVIAEAVEQVNPLIGARRHRLALELAPLPLMVHGDRKRLVQVLGNILNNAAKYTAEGGRIQLRAGFSDQQVEIEVSDNGIGMAPDTVRRVFDLFAQAERTPDRSSGGLGLGLALVKNLVELHKGSISCASQGLGTGSTFRLRLPACAAPEQPAAPVPAQAQRAAPEGLHILVVDDNVDAAEMLAMLLAASGHAVDVEHAPLQALRHAIQARPQVCLLDIGLPDMDGNELARRLRAAPETHDAMLVAITGYGELSSRNTAMAAGFDHYLVKPVDSAKLAQILAGVRA